MFRGVAIVTVGVRTEVWLVATPANAEAMAAAAADPAAAVGIV